METVTDFIFLGSKITADGDCSHEIQRHLFLGRKSMTNLNSILKSRDITLLTKIHIVKAVVFPVIMYGCELDHKEGWAQKNCAGEDVVLEKSLAQQGDQTSQSYRKSVLNIHWKDWCWSWSSNILVTWCEELTHLKRPWCLERLRAGREGRQRMRWFEDITDLMDMSLSKLWEIVKDRVPRCSAIHGVVKSRRTQPSDSTKSR